MSNVKYYLVQYLDTDKQEYIKCTLSLVVGSIYNKDNDTYLGKIIIADKLTRKENKNKVVKTIIQMFNNIL